MGHHSVVRFVCLLHSARSRGKEISRPTAACARSRTISVERRYEVLGQNGRIAHLKLRGSELRDDSELLVGRGIEGRRTARPRPASVGIGKGNSKSPPASPTLKICVNNRRYAEVPEV